MNWFTDTASWALILGVLTPLVVAVVQQPRWGTRYRAVVAAVAAVIVGVVTVLANGTWQDASGTLGIIALVLVASNTAYKTLWKPTGVAPLIEAKTSPGGAHVVTTVEEEPTATPNDGPRPASRDEYGYASWIPPVGAVVAFALLVLLLIGLS
jgi:hypothetical protein